MTTRGPQPSTASAVKETIKEPMDKLLFALTWVLITVGIFTVYDASYAVAIEHQHGHSFLDSFHLVGRQALWTVFGVLALWTGWRVPYWRWYRAGIYGVAIVALLLVAVFIPHIGFKINNSHRWIGHGMFQLQPSEVAKLVLVIYLARVCATGARTMRQFSTGILPPLCVIGLLAVLIAKEPDMGTALVLVGTGLIMLFLAGAKPKHLALVIVLILLVAIPYTLHSQYRMKRLNVYVNPKSDPQGEAYQVTHALIALGSGGITGTGLGEGREKLYIPEPNTDFIFPVFAEEWGLIGTLSLVAVFLLLAARGYSIAYRTKDPFGALLGAGITTLITLQALVNIGVATGSIPNTGVPLPFISYGGSALVLMMAGIGILLNISCYPNGRGIPESARPAPGERDWNRRWERGAYLPSSQAPVRPTEEKSRSDRARSSRSGRTWE